MRSIELSVLMSLAAVIGAVATARAEDTARTLIGDDALRSVKGAASVNVAAGDVNLQFNAIAVSLNRAGEARALLSLEQRGNDSTASVIGDARARIDDRAFAGATGFIAVNQASGHGNLQANAIAFAVGVEGKAVAEIELAQLRGGAAPPDAGGATRVRSAIVESGAFRNASGVVQVNQAAGVSNVSANSIALRLAVGVNP